MAPSFSTAIPNLLTFARLAAAPAVALAFALLDRPAADLAALALFALASATDWLDGALARRWGVESAVGRMMDPIADKAMVTIALACVLAASGPNWLILLPAAAILFREVAVSGLREFLAGRVAVPVSRLAKWKTGAQMTAIAVLLAAGWAEARTGMLHDDLTPRGFAAVMGGEAPDEVALRLTAAAAPALAAAGIALLWAAAALTAVTGLDYFRRALADPAFRPPAPGP